MLTRLLYGMVCLSMLLAVGSAALASSKGVSLGETSYPTIQSAIDAASPGAVIEIEPGTYMENLTIDKPLTLRGNRQGDILLQAADPESPAISIRGGGLVAVSGFTITGSNAGVQVDETQVLLHDNSISVQEAGIQGWNFAQTGSVVMGNHFVGPSSGHVLYGTGLILLGVADWTVIGNTFEDLATGLLLAGGAEVHVENNQVSACGNGIRIGSVASVTLLENEIVGNCVSGIVLSESASVQLTENTIRSNAQCGVRLADPVESFTGAVTGSGNDIGGNGRVNLYPVTFAWPKGFSREP